ncbi:MAG: YCF48-related protein [Candidatus Neomarinimicrobiota bacterium]
MRTDRIEDWKRSNSTEIDRVALARSPQKSQKGGLFWSAIICFCWIVLTFQIVLAKSVTIQGTVTTSNLMPVKYASITFINQNDTTQKYSIITDTSGCYRLTVPTGIDHFDYKLPNNIELAQNYPNPFSASTTIQYKLNRKSDVKITIYDLLGREVRNLISENKSPRVYSIIWDGKNKLGKKVSSGVYIYKLQAGNETQVKKMLYMNGIEIHSEPLFSNQFISNKELVLRDILPSSYNVQISNVDSTQPFIFPCKIRDILIQKDTTVNFTVNLYGTWSKLRAGVSIWLRDIVFIDEQIGWAVGDSGTILHTINGGDSWQKQTFPWEELPGLTNYEDNLVSVTFLDSIFGWICSRNSILKTTDGGENWKITYSENLEDGRFHDIGFIDKNIGFAVGGKGFLGSMGFLLKTSDSGETWENITPLSFSTLTHLSIVDEEFIWVCGYGGIVITTNDSGLTWIKKELNASPAPYLTSIQFVDQYNGWCGGDDNSWPYLNFFCTTDGGNSWTPRSMENSWPIFLGVNSIFFVDSLNGWIGTIPGAWQYAIYHTIDGGLTWQSLPMYMNIYNIFSFCFINKKLGWAVGTHEINKKAEGVILRYENNE